LRLGGGNTAKSAAVAFARANGMKTLDMTIKGRLLQVLEKYIPEKLANKLWEKASSSFAKGAEGTANVFHNATDGVRLESVWRNVEYPVLKDNVNLIYHDVFR